MSHYEEKIYAFLSQEKNFEPFFDLHQQYDNVRLRLVHDFWELVGKKIMEKLPAGTEWYYVIDPPGTSPRKFRIVHKEAAAGNGAYRGGIAFQHIDSSMDIYGVLFNRDLCIDYLRCFPEISMEAETIVGENPGWRWVEGANWWFPINREFKEDFRSKITLMELTVERREGKAEVYADAALDVLERFGNFFLLQIRKQIWL